MLTNIGNLDFYLPTIKFKKYFFFVIVLDILLFTLSA